MDAGDGGPEDANLRKGPGFSEGSCQRALASRVSPWFPRRMLPRALLVVVLSLFSLPLGSEAAGKKSQSYYFTLHLQGSPDQGAKFVAPVKLGSEAQQYYFSVIPELTDNHVAAIYPFTSKDGASFGVAFILNEKGRERLSGLTLQNQGRLVGVHVLGTHNSALYVDHTIDDGVVVVWEGLGKSQVKDLSKKFQVVEAHASEQ